MLRAEYLKYKKSTDESINQYKLKNKAMGNEICKLKQEIESLHVKIGHLEGE